MHQPTVFLDLDDTLFQSRRKLKEFAGLDNEQIDRLATGACGPDGTPNAFQLPHQQSFSKWLFESCEIIPTTCRSLEQFHRAHLPRTEFAIVHCGAVILKQGQVDSQWQAIMNARLAPIQEPLRDALGIAEQKLACRENPIVRFGTCNNAHFFVNAKDRTGDASLINELALELQSSQWAKIGRVIQQDANLYFIPQCVDKRHAAEHLLQTELTTSTCTIGVGDSELDAGFLDLCDFAILPQNSELWSCIAHRFLAEGEA